MIIYKDLLSESKDEILSDIYFNNMEKIDNIIYKVQGKLKEEKTEVDDSLIGGNASAEGADAGEGGEAAVARGINIVLAHRLVEFDINKKNYKTHIMDYMKRVKAHLEEEKPDEVKSFMEGAQKFVKGQMGEFKEWQFFCGESMLPEGMLIMCKWEEEVPYMYYFIHGLEEEKV